MKKVSRRTFARHALVAATAAAVLPNALAQTVEPVPKTPAAEPKPAAGPPQLPPASQAEVDARVNWVLTKYGPRLNDEQRADVRRLIQGAQRGVDAMRNYALDNAVAPAAPFRVYRAGRAPHPSASRGRGKKVTQ